MENDRCCPRAHCLLRRYPFAYPLRGALTADCFLDTMTLAEEGLVTRDLALRLSATLKDPLAGYTFGRNEARCDFVLSHKASEGAKRISNIHFRVWVTEQGVIMLEDQSTNGTWLEGKHLRAKSAFS